MLRDSQWIEIDVERADYYLNVLPPIDFPGGFFVGEPATHDDRGVPVHTAVVQRGARYFERDCAIDRASSGRAVKELDDALRCELLIRDAAQAVEEIDADELEA